MAERRQIRRPVYSFSVTVGSGGFDVVRQVRNVNTGQTWVVMTYDTIDEANYLMQTLGLLEVKTVLHRQQRVRELRKGKSNATNNVA